MMQPVKWEAVCPRCERDFLQEIGDDTDPPVLACMGCVDADTGEVEDFYWKIAWNLYDEPELEPITKEDYDAAWETFRKRFGPEIDDE